LPPSDSTYNYQKVSAFVAYRKNINTSSLTEGEYSIPGNLHRAISLHIQNSSKSQASSLTSLTEKLNYRAGNASMVMKYGTN
jgi:negative regulator of genetic competence, sporulation and motility